MFARNVVAGCLLIASALAQDRGFLEGTVTSSPTHSGIGGVAVTIAKQQVLTNAAGAFRLDGVPVGTAAISIKAAGYLPAERSVRVNSRGPAVPLRVELVPESSISGRVLDERGNPLAGVQVVITEAMRGTGMVFRIFGGNTDKDGWYRQDQLAPGTYLVMARPKPSLQKPAQSGASEARYWVNTFYPDTAVQAQAAGVVLRGGTQAIADIHLLASPVYPLRGRLRAPDGKLVDGKVKLQPLYPAPLDLFQAPEAKTNAGVFVFPSVPPGEWSVQAEASSAEGVLRGASAVVIDGRNPDDLTVSLLAPFSVTATIEPEQADNSVMLALIPTDRPAIGVALAKPDPRGKYRSASAYPGNYRVEAYGTVENHYLDSVRIGDRDVLGKVVMFADGSAPIRVTYKSDAAAVQGSVEECGTASVVIFPEDQALWDFRFLRHTSCDEAGRVRDRRIASGNVSRARRGSSDRDWIGRSADAAETGPNRNHG